MQVRWKVAVLSAVAAGGLVGLSLVPQANAAPHKMRFDDLTKTQKRLMSGFASAEVDQARGALARRAAPSPKRYGSSAGNFYFPSGSRGCSYTLGGDVNMDTDCQNVTDPDLAGRGQAQNETYISEDHYRAGNLLGSSNDYRRGDGGCFGYYSLDNGRSFQDVAIPNSFTRAGPPMAERSDSIGRPAATPPAPSTPAATPTTAVRSSTAARAASRRTPTSAARCWCSGPPATAARRTPSPAASWGRGRTSPAPAPRPSSTSSS